ncbi:unnamed protein product [Dracunculus medinensis]|uniref:Uncharacterized protein n=1 Tax=Dracunculus medinensis TaxID=318479 RepID=A0A3P7QEG0_DRAME|nr:unnamed protein product [Dracunculus medinensis]
MIRRLSTSNVTTDRFTPVLENFLKTANNVDTAKSSPNEFFLNLSKFLCFFMRYYNEMGKARKSRRNKELNIEIDFGQLVIVIQSGEIFSNEMNRLRTSFHCRKKTIKNFSRSE